MEFCAKHRGRFVLRYRQFRQMAAWSGFCLYAAPVRDIGSVLTQADSVDDQLSEQPNQNRSVLRQWASSNPTEPRPNSASVVGSGTTLYG